MPNRPTNGAVLPTDASSVRPLSRRAETWLISWRRLRVTTSLRSTEVPSDDSGLSAAALRAFSASGANTPSLSAACSVAILLSYLCGAVLRGAGDSRTPLKAAVLANAVNVVLDYVLIFGHFGFPELGVGGSAWGAAIGRAVGAVFMLIMLWSGRVKLSIRGRAGWFPNVEMARSLFKLGLPAAFEQVVMQFGFISLVAIAASIGTDALAAQQISFTAMSIAFLPTIALALNGRELALPSIATWSKPSACPT